MPEIHEVKDYNFRLEYDASLSAWEITLFRDKTDVGFIAVPSVLLPKLRSALEDMEMAVWRAKQEQKKSASSG